MKNVSDGMRLAAFLDANGILNENAKDHVKSGGEFIFLPHVFEALQGQ